MPILDLTDDQVVELVKQLPWERQRTALLALATGAAQRRGEAERQLQRLCTERGLDWDTMTEDEREAFVDGLVHEDRPCGP